MYSVEGRKLSSILLDMMILELKQLAELMYIFIVVGSTILYHFSREDPHLKERNGLSPASRWGMNRTFLCLFNFELQYFPLLL